MMVDINQLSDPATFFVFTKKWRLQAVVQLETISSKHNQNEEVLMICNLFVLSSKGIGETLFKLACVFSMRCFLESHWHVHKTKHV